MDLCKVLFIGGGGGSMAAVNVRCRDIAERLCCDFIYGGKFIAQIPDKYSAYVCVKPAFQQAELQRLAEKGLIIWDII
jgi:hypothetical protein